ncbi:MAG: hypothetical protein HYY56_01445 [Candidatus Omnitrophica bacterium]|nr:hypothetical protein [Candidatus Omnitrophota bacterium]
MGLVDVMEIKGIGAWSMFKLIGGTFMVIGLIAGLIAGLSGQFFGLESIEFIDEIISKGPLAISLLGLGLGMSCGIALGLSCAILALIYNFFAMIMGGIKIVIK